MNIGIITQARTTSTRLPSKILLKIQEKTLLEYHINRLKRTNIPIYIATTSNEADNQIIEIAKQLNCPVYRGSEHDVLSRFYHCATNFSLDIIIRVTSDCPLIDASEINKGLNYYLENNNLTPNHLYLSNTLQRTFPKGMDFEIFSFEMLEKAYINSSTKDDREHVTPYFYNGTREDIQLINYSNTHDTSDLRLTLDFQEDYDFFQLLIEKYSANRLRISEIEDLIHKHSELIDLNRKCKTIAKT